MSPLKYDKKCEYGFPPQEFGAPAEENPHADASPTGGEPQSKALEYPAPETVTKSRPETVDRHSSLKKMLLMPAVAAAASVTVLLSSFNVDFLGSSSPAGSGYSPPAAPSGTDPGSAPGTSALAGETADAEFPRLSNLEPNSPVASAPYHSELYGVEIEGVLNEEYIHLYGLDGSGVYVMQNDGSGNEQINDSIDGISYDRKTNTLTLENFHGDVLAFNLMGNGLKIELVGDNSLRHINGWGFYVGGSVTFTGSGSLVVNGDKDFAIGILLDCEWSETCLMIDGSVSRLEVFGKAESDPEPGGERERDAHGAIFISDTAMDKAIYYLAPLKLTGGTRASGIFGEDAYYNRADSYSFGDYHDYSVVDDDGNPSMHVVFARD